MSNDGELSGRGFYRRLLAPAGSIFLPNIEIQCFRTHSVFSSAKAR